ncbi:hypothetical protein AB4345_02395 [Vibrio breoganii]|uniref:hypothetical protein n=1 Tax=Vibrio breoganii TaxID=553239 RepID=UPI0002DAFF5F|nr:hypothetical protein [Vibrio breoganii]OEF86065.1 hypothetical protein B003_16295 [Vibrio breoganii 1C10]PMI20707.1 hypothetical protein BCU49_06010 [Vibrio breoganii]PMO58829.1 hypothetical protein BCT06_15585 [Vibrio breoganii]
MYRNQSTPISSQRGNVYIIAIFVIVVMGMLALNLTRISWSNQDTLTREVLGSQASLLAQSGNEWALTHLFPLDGEDDFNSLSARCGTLGTSANDAGAALVGNSGIPCIAPTIACETSPSGIPDELRYLKVSTQATCSDGSVFEVEREETVWVRGIKDE